MVDECLCVSKREREEWRVLFQLLCVFAGENKQLHDLICALTVWAFYFILLNSRVSNVCVCMICMWTILSNILAI